jgi:hypothetical protein
MAQSVDPEDKLADFGILDLISRSNEAEQLASNVLKNDAMNAILDQF